MDAQIEEVLTERVAAVAATRVTDTQPRPSVSALISEADGIDAVKAELSKLRRRFNALSANFKTAKDALQKRKDEREKWKQHALRLEDLIAAAEEEHGIQILHRKKQGSRASSRVLGIVHEPESLQNAQGGDAKAELPPVAATTTARKENTMTNMPSESTQGEAEDGSEEQLPQLQAKDPNDLVSVKHEPSSDGPVFLSERVVRKRKRETGPDASELRVKVEPQGDSSSPTMSRGRFAFNTQDSLDLGDIEQRMTTPRKPKELEPSAPIANGSAPKLETSFATPATAVATYRRLPQSAAGAKRPSVLTPLSANVRTARSLGDKSNVPRRKRDLGYAISSLAEDGDVYGTGTSTANTNKSTTAQPTLGSLSTLLNSPSPADGEEIILRRAAQRGSSKRGSRATVNVPLPIPERRELPFERGAAGKSFLPQVEGESTPRPDRSLVRKSILEKPSPRLGPSSSRSIRSKPFEELRLEDFKINPRANDGHDFAYSDVVRGRGERACLPGCTDMHCCGKQFRALALSQRPNPPLTPAQRMEEHKLLEDYLGDHAYRLVSMTREERDELWVEAKTAELANKYGKHRHRFSRMQSPPGFWNADFPSTQEREADREEAARREQQTIRDRYRSAMVPGGRWMFRDE